MRRLKSFIGDAAGGAAVEFALILPILAALVVLSIDGWSAVRHALDMHAAVQSGVRYLQGGGRDDDDLETISLAAWPRRTADSAVAAERLCKCGDLATVCTELCVDRSAPSAYVTLRAQTVYRGLVADLPLQETEVLRVR